MSARMQSRNDWMKVLDELATDIAAMEMKISQIKDHEVPDMEKAAQQMRERLKVVVAGLK